MKRPSSKYLRDEAYECRLKIFLCTIMGSALEHFDPKCRTGSSRARREAGRIAIIEKAKPAVLSIFEAQGGWRLGRSDLADGYAIRISRGAAAGDEMRHGRRRVYDAVLVA